MKNLGIGCDIVDLKQYGPPFHLRYFKRVLSPSEQIKVGNDLLMLQCHWAAKEAAFKALSSLHAGLVFAPSKFEFVKDESIVIYNGVERIKSELKVEDKDGYVSCLCVAGSKRPEDENCCYYIDSIKAHENPSIEVRRLLLKEAASFFKVDQEVLEVVQDKKDLSAKSLPILINTITKERFLISLSHDGRFLMCALIGYPSM